MYNFQTENYSANSRLDQTEVYKIYSLIEAGKFKDKVVALDFDNTCIVNDVGEATFEVLVKTRKISKDSIPPSQQILHGQKVTEDLIGFYKNFTSMQHNLSEQEAVESIYQWLVKIMQGVTPSEVVEATALAIDENHPLNYFPKPRADREMVELVGKLNDAGADIWIISASNPWSVRLAVKKFFNQASELIKLNQVVGLAAELKDRKKNIFNDRILVNMDMYYANLDLFTLDRYTLTDELSEPLSMFEGKAEIVKTLLPQLPFLVVGDSQNDVPMMMLAEHRLWVGRN